MLPCTALPLKYTKKTLCYYTINQTWELKISFKPGQKGSGSCTPIPPLRWSTHHLGEAVGDVSQGVSLTDPSLGPRRDLPKGTMAWTYCPIALGAPQNVAGCRKRKQVQLRFPLELPLQRTTAKHETADNKSKTEKKKSLEIITTVFLVHSTSPK